MEVVIVLNATSAGSLLRAPVNLPQRTHSHARRHAITALLVFHISAHTVGHVFGPRKGPHVEAAVYRQPNTSSDSAETA